MAKESHENSSLVKAEEYAKDHEDTEENIIQLIREGSLAGRIKDNIWYVDIGLSENIRSSSGNTSSRSDPVSEDFDPKLVGISGWLILPAIGFVLGPIIGILGLIASFGMYSDLARAGFGELSALELIVLTGLIGFLIYAAILFFKKKKNAPRIIITLFIVGIVASVILLVVEIGAGAKMFAVETGKQLIRDVIGAAIWIPYFKVSKRVKATFVH